MRHSDVTVVRIYLTEGEKLMKTLLAKLHDEEKVRGVTVFRGISGFGRSGVVHSSTLLDLSLDLPVVWSSSTPRPRSSAFSATSKTCCRPDTWFHGRRR